MKKYSRFLLIFGLLLVFVGLFQIFPVRSDDYYHCEDLGAGCLREYCWSAVYPRYHAECIFWCYETGWGWYRLGCYMD